VIVGGVSVIGNPVLSLHGRVALPDDTGEWPGVVRLEQAVGREMGERERLAVVLEQIDGWIGTQGAAGVGAAIWWKGEIAAERYAGEAMPGVPVDERTIFPLASVTKPVVAAGIVSLAEAGAFSLDETAARYVSEFRAGPEAGAEGVDPGLERQRQSITLRQLLCHVSGLPEDMAGRMGRFTSPATLDELTDVMCRLPLQSAPGAVLRYSNAGYAVLGRAVERAAGTGLWTAVEQQVLDPLGMTDTLVRPSGEVAGRVAHLADASHAGTELETYNGAYWRGLAVPWAGLYGTPRDLARFGGAFLPGGPRLLSGAARDLMVHDQTGGVPGGVESARVAWSVGRWGLGWEVKGGKQRHWTGEFTSPRTVCHFGHAGTLLWADPEHEVALAVFANRAVTHMWTFILGRWARLSNAVIAAVS
jgi:CubicO group peptidase (beta-lactamase class C family)